MNYRVERITGCDVPRMREMLAMFGAAFEDAATYGGNPPSDAYVQEFLDRSDTIAIAALSGTVVGGLVAYVLRKFEQERSEVYIYDLAVAEEYRRRGIATAMIGELRRVAAALGAHIIYVQADRGDDRAIALYESLGKREDVFHFDIEV